MAQEKILVVDDEEDILELVQLNLVKEGFKVSCATTGEVGLQLANSERPDLIVLDLMLPGIDGLEVCRAIKKDPKLSEIAIVMLSAKGEESDIVTGLELGAEDYITKPFSPKVMVARVRAALRRKQRDDDNDGGSFRIHDLTVNPGRHEVLVKDQSIDLTSTEFKILNFMARRPGWVFTRYQIVEAIHGPGYPVTDRSVDVQISGLRTKLGECGGYIETIRGVGYRFKD